MSLQLFLATNYNSETLNEFVKLCATVLQRKERPTRKDDRARFLADALLNPKDLHRIWQAMDDTMQKAVGAAYHNGGEFNADAFVAQYGSLPARPMPFGWYTRTPILMDLFIHRQRIPPELMPLLADLAPLPERFQLSGVADLATVDLDQESIMADLTVAETEETGWHDLLLFLQMVDQRSLKFASGNNQLTPASAALLAGQLLHGDFFVLGDLPVGRRQSIVAQLVRARRGGAAEEAPRPAKDVTRLKVAETIRPFGLTAFAVGAGLVLPHKQALTEQGRALLTAPEPELLLEALEQWSRQSRLDEITRVKAVKGLGARGVRLTDPALRRECILEALSWCPVGEWIRIADFYRALKIWHFDFAIEEGGIDKLYVGYRYGWGGDYEPWAGQESMWMLTTGLYVNVVLWEYLAVIGALDIAFTLPGESEYPAETYGDYDGDYYSLYDGLHFFRINPLGAYLFGQTGEYRRRVLATTPLLRVADGGRLVVLDPAQLTPVVKAQLEQIATLEAENVYRLDEAKTLYALEQGSDVALLREQLERYSNAALPAEAETWLAQIARNSRAFTLGGELVRVRAASAELAQLVLGDDQLSKYCQALDQRTLVLPTSRKAAFQRRLRELGYGVR